MHTPSKLQEQLEPFSIHRQHRECPRIHSLAAIMNPNIQYKMDNPTESSARRIEPATCSVSVVSSSSLTYLEVELTCAEDSRSHHLTDIQEQDAGPTNVVSQWADSFDGSSISILVDRYPINIDLFTNLCVPCFYVCSINVVAGVSPEEMLQVRCGKSHHGVVRTYRF